MISLFSGVFVDVVVVDLKLPIGSLRNEDDDGYEDFI